MVVSPHPGIEMPGYSHRFLRNHCFAAKSPNQQRCCLWHAEAMPAAAVEQFAQIKPAELLRPDLRLIG